MMVFDVIIGINRGYSLPLDEKSQTLMDNTEETTPLLSASDPDYNSYDKEHALRCPECGGPNGLHIDGVSLENASGERVLVHAAGEDASSHFDVQHDRNSSHNGRRHQISLLGWCELCGKKFSLTFKQHKGMTYYSKIATENADGN